MKLSKIFKTKKINRDLKQYLQSHKDDVEFQIITIIDEITTKDAKLDKQSEQLLSSNILQCLQMDCFTQIPSSVIYQILEKSDKSKLSSDILYDFVCKSINEFCELLAFVDLSKLSEDKFNDLRNKYGKNKKVTKHLPLNLDTIKIFRDKNEELMAKLEELEREKNQLQAKIDMKEKKKKEPLLKNVPKYARLHVKICQASDLISFFTVSKSNPYVTLRLNSQGKKDAQKTQVISNTPDPIWNQEFDIFVNDPNDVLLINMYDEDLKKDEKIMDELSFPVNSFTVGGPNERKEIQIKFKKKKAGRLIFEIQAFSE